MNNKIFKLQAILLAENKTNLIGTIILKYFCFYIYNIFIIISIMIG